MPLWNDFLDKVAKPVGRFVEKTAMGTLEMFGGPSSFISPSAAVSNIVLPAATNIGTSKILSQQGLSEAAQKGIKENLNYEVKTSAPNSDLVLRAAIAANENFISPYVTRPVSTIGLLADPTSPLYQPGEFEKGFQVKDVKAAYKRSEKVTTMQALTKSELIPLVAPISQAILGLGDIDTAKINLWNDEDIQKNYIDNTVGRWYTGIGDFTVGNLALAGAGKLIGAAGTTGLKRAGVMTKGKTLETFEAEINDGIAFTNSGGTTGRQSVAAADVEALANTTDINFITNKIKDYSNNEDLIGPIQRATDPNTVKDLILADKGYLPALDRLSKNAPADLYELANVNATIVSRVIDTGELYHPTGIALDRINSAFDNAINQVPQYREIYNAFMDPMAKSPRVLGKEYFPAEPIFGKETYIKARGVADRFKAAKTTREFNNEAVTRNAGKMGIIEERIIGISSKGPVTRLIRFTGTHKPLGFVTFSGARPFDGLTELNAVFDDVALFANGTNTVKVSPTKFVTAGEYRNRFVSEFLNAKTDIARNEVLDLIDERMGVDLARTYGWSNEAEVVAFIRDMKARLATNHNNLARDGFAIDAQGRKIDPDPYTQRQLIESRRMSPWGMIEQEIIKASKVSSTKRAGLTANDQIKALFEASNKIWTLDVLARPSYIPKQSIGEPSLSAFLSQGSAFIAAEVPNMTTNFLKNSKNRILGQASRVLRGGETAAVNKTVDSISNQLNDAVSQLNQLTAEYSSFFDMNMVSPATRAQNGGRVVEDLKAAQNLVDELELSLRDAVKPFGGIEQVPSLTNLERRLAYLETTGSVTKANIGAAVANAKAAIGRAKGQINTLAPDPADIYRVNEEIAQQYKIIDDIVKNLGEAKYKQAQVFGKSAEFKKRYYGKEENYRMINGQWTKLDSLFDENQFGKAMRAELENSQTVAATYLNELSVGVRQNALMRKAPSTITDIDSPIYFEELAWVVNRAMRGDPLIDQILAGVPEKGLLEWGLANKSYFDQFGTYTDMMIPGLIQDRVAFVNRYIPNVEARALVLEREVTSADLQLLMAKDIDRMSAIHPNDFDYHLASDTFGLRGLARLDKFISRTSGKIFKILTAPENPIRWAVGDKIFLDTVARKADALAKQGVDFTGEGGLARLNALRQSASIEAIQETERVFYTIRRQNRGLYTIRAAVAFPAASLNAFYRYGRFAIKNPTRTAGFLRSYQGLFESFGVDQYGNPVENPLDATHIIVPGTKEMGAFGGKGVRLNARSLGFLLNIPSPSIYAAISVGTIMKAKPSTEDTMKSILGPTYDVIFPYGPETSIAEGLTPAWARDFYKYYVGPKGDRDFLTSWKSVHNYYMTLQDMKLGKYPGEKAVYEEAKALFGQKARWSFASPFGVPAKVDTRPMQIFDDYYDILVNKYREKGFNDEIAKEKAGDEFLANVGPNFPLDRITYKGSTSNVYVQPTVEAYNRIWKEDFGLVEALGKIDTKLIGLLTSDIETKKEDFNLSVYNILKNPNTMLPNNVRLNDVALTPKQEEERRQVNRTWEKYNNVRDTLEKAALDKDGKSLRSHPELREILKKYANTELKESSQLWWDEWNESERGDNSFRYARAFNEIVNNKEWMKKFGDTKFFQDVKKFDEQRQIIVSVYQALPDRDPRKSRLKQVYELLLESNSGQWHPKLQEIINRYFTEDTMKAVK